MRQELIDSEQRWQALRQAAVEAERNRLARDLHHSVSQSLFSVAAIAQALPRIWQKHPDEARRGLEELARLSQGTFAEMRNLLLELRPAGLAEKPFGDLLQQLINAIEGQTHIRVQMTVVGDRLLPTDVKVVFYRIAQEALHNIIKQRKD